MIDCDTMKLLNNFYTIESIELTDQGRLECIVRLLEYHDIYRGHFPSVAVVPGVCTLTIVKECAGLALGHDIRFSTIRKCKFMSLLTPEKNLGLKLSFQITGTILKGTVSRLSDNQTTIKLDADITQ